MRFSLTRLLQWGGIALVLLALVGLNYDFDSEAGMRLNSSVEDSIATGVRGYWKLDDGTGTNATDGSGNGNTLAMTGSPSWVTGNIGPSALDFSGSGQYLSVADPASGVLDFSQGASFSLTGWFNRDTFASDHTIVAKKNDQSTSSEAGYIVWIDNNGTTDTLCFAAYGTAGYSLCSTTEFNATGWHHFAISWNDSATTNPVNIFIDGALSNGTPSGTFSSVASLANARDFRIGAESDAGNPFDGKIDDIRIYGNSLSASEVQKIYQTTAPMQVQLDSGLVGYWTFDGPDIQGTTAIDRSGKGNNGTITGAVPTLGKLGQGLSFDGSSNAIDVGGPTLTNTFTYSVWMYLSGASGSFRPIITNGYYGLSFAPNTSSSCSYSNRIFFDVGSFQCSNTDLSENRWYHVAVVNNAGSATFYIDGVSGGTASLGAYAPTVSTIGYNYNPNYFSGKLDDVRIYNRALSATEIVDIYRVGK